MSSDNPSGFPSRPIEMGPERSTKKLQIGILVIAVIGAVVYLTFFAKPAWWPPARWFEPSSKEQAITAYNKGVTLAKNDQLKEAIPLFEEAIRHNPKMRDAHYNRGVCYSRLGERAKAVESFTKVIELTPYIGHAYLTRAREYTLLSDWDKAVADLKQARLLDADKEKIDDLTEKLLIILIANGREDLLKELRQDD